MLRGRYGLLLASGEIKIRVYLVIIIILITIITIIIMVGLLAQLRNS